MMPAIMTSSNSTQARRTRIHPSARWTHGNIVQACPEVLAGKETSTGAIAWSRSFVHHSSPASWFSFLSHLFIFRESRSASEISRFLSCPLS